MSRAPVLGFNNNVRHRGRLFHIQTEDSGVKFSRIVTHLFADGGRIIKTARIDYLEHAEKDDVATIVRSLMKEQHRAMFTSLRAGELDALLEKAIGPLPEPSVAQRVAAPRAQPALVSAPPSTPVETPDAAAASLPAAPPSTRRRDSNRPASRPASERPPRRRPIPNPNLHGVAPSVPPPTPEAFDLDVATLERLPQAPAPRPSPRKTKSRPPPPARAVTAPQRPATPHANPPGTAARSIFGDGAVSEQTLDEVILSYLAEDLDGSGEK